MKKLSAKIMLVLGATLVASCSTAPQEEVVRTSFYHAYGPKVAETDWKEQGSTGQVVEQLKSGVEVRKEYRGGVLDGVSSWTFPHSPVVERTEQYARGTKVLATRNYENGSPERREEFLANGRLTVSTWYADGAPRSIEEFLGTLVQNAKYFTIDGEEESSIAAGNGTRVARSRSGELLYRESISSSHVVVRESFFPNGHLRESISYQGSQRHGQTRRFAESGEPVAVEQWKQGVLDGPQLFFEMGQLSRQVPYLQGRKEGVELRFRPGTDEVVEETSWHQDAKHGASKVHLADQVVTDWYWKGGKVSEDQYRVRSGTDIAIAR